MTLESGTLEAATKALLAALANEDWEKIKNVLQTREALLRGLPGASIFEMPHADELRNALSGGAEALAQLHALKLRLRTEYGRLSQLREGFASTSAAPVTRQIDLRV